MSVYSYSEDYTLILGAFNRPLSEGAVVGDDVYFSIADEIAFDLESVPLPAETNYVDVYRAAVQVDIPLTVINTSSYNQVDDALKLGSYCWTREDYNYLPSFLNYQSQWLGNIICFSLPDKFGSALGTLEEIITLSSEVPSVIANGVRIRLTGSSISSSTISAQYNVQRLTTTGTADNICWLSVGFGVF
jgi:hypothetical protein